MVDQHSHTTQAHEKRQSEPDSEALSAQENNFQQCDENRDGRQHDRRNSRGDTLLRPKQATVVDQEDEGTQKKNTSPLSPVRRRCTPQAHPPEQGQTGDAKAQGSQQEWRYFVHSDAYG